MEPLGPQNRRMYKGQLQLTTVIHICRPYIHSLVVRKQTPDVKITQYLNDKYMKTTPFSARGDVLYSRRAIAS